MKMKKFYVTIIILLAFAFVVQCYGETSTAEANEMWPEVDYTAAAEPEMSKPLILQKPN